MDYIIAVERFDRLLILLVLKRFKIKLGQFLNTYTDSASYKCYTLGFLFCFVG